jgi:uncharacterized C2H2 Zn-finger protein
MSYGSATVPCPHCGSASTHQITMRDGGQVVSCPSCHKNFRIYVNQGQVRRTSKT